MARTVRASSHPNDRARPTTAGGPSANNSVNGQYGRSGAASYSGIRTSGVPPVAVDSSSNKKSPPQPTAGPLANVEAMAMAKLVNPHQYNRACALGQLKEQLGLGPEDYEQPLFSRRFVNKNPGVLNENPQVLVYTKQTDVTYHSACIRLVNVLASDRQLLRGIHEDQQ